MKEINLGTKQTELNLKDVNLTSKDLLLQTKEAKLLLKENRLAEEKEALDYDKESFSMIKDSFVIQKKAFGEKEPHSIKEASMTKMHEQLAVSSMDKEPENASNDMLMIQKVKMKKKRLYATHWKWPVTHSQPSLQASRKP
jgi:hypothetical protein